MNNEKKIEDAEHQLEIWQMTLRGAYKQVERIEGYVQAWKDEIQRLKAQP